MWQPLTEDAYTFIQTNLAQLDLNQNQGALHSPG